MPPTNESEKNSGPKALRTFQGDVEQMIQEGNGSLTKIAIAESNKRSTMPYVGMEPEAPKHNILLIVGIVGLLLVSVGLLSSLYFFKSSDKPVTENNTYRPVLLADSQKNLNVTGLSRDQIIKTLLQERGSASSNLSAIESIVMTEDKTETAQPLPVEQFLSKLQSHAPSELTRSLDSDYMFGIHVLNKKQFFLVLKTSYYQNAYAGMLSWEKNLKEDLGAFFIYPDTASTATTSTALLQKVSGFQDAVVKNRDARVLRGANGAINFLYSFPDKNTIIITTNADTLEQVTSRLLKNKLVQ
ncbi:MAG: hypothetical protein V4467_02860 [Patescibacteria group bacterium]